MEKLLITSDNTAYAARTFSKVLAQNAIATSYTPIRYLLIAGRKILRENRTVVIAPIYDL